MNKKLKRRWIAALRGGSWVQIRGKASGEMPNERCASQILYEMDSGYFDEHYNNVINYVEGQIGGGGVFALPIITQKRVPNAFHDMIDKVVKMNDSGYQFNEIADWIEVNVPEDELDERERSERILSYGDQHSYYITVPA